MLENRNKIINTLKRFLNKGSFELFAAFFVFMVNFVIDELILNQLDNIFFNHFFSCPSFKVSVSQILCFVIYPLPDS